MPEGLAAAGRVFAFFIDKFSFFKLEIYTEYLSVVVLLSHGQDVVLTRENWQNSLRNIFYIFVLNYFSRLAGRLTKIALCLSVHIIMTHVHIIIIYIPSLPAVYVTGDGGSRNKW